MISYRRKCSGVDVRLRAMCIVWGKEIVGFEAMPVTSWVLWDSQFIVLLTLSLIIIAPIQLSFLAHPEDQKKWWLNMKTCRKEESEMRTQGFNNKELWASSVHLVLGSRRDRRERHLHHHRGIAVCTFLGLGYTWISTQIFVSHVVIRKAPNVQLKTIPGERSLCFQAKSVFYVYCFQCFLGSKWSRCFWNFSLNLGVSCYCYY